MTTPTGPADPGQTRPQTGIPAGDVPAEDVPAEEVDVRYLAGQRLPADGAWLWITTAKAEPEGEFTAVFLPGAEPHPHGGDVLLHVYPATCVQEQAVPDAQVRVVAVVAESLVLVAGWERLDLDFWPERVRATTAFARGVLGELRDHGADLGGSVQIAPQAARPVVAGFPFLESKMTP
jgi:hypothetical protein